MSRRPTSIFDASIKFRCLRPGCGHEFLVKPGALERDRRATCPKCLLARQLTDEEIMHRRAANVAELPTILRAEFGEDSSEPE